MKTYPIVEIFGPTIQGEGALAGKPTHFIRFGGCDFRCEWCDSAPAVLPELVRKAPKMDLGEILLAVRKLEGAPKWVTLSGGNPALFDLDALVRTLHVLNYKVAVETQGTIYKAWLRQTNMLTVSPKPPSAGNVVTIEMLARFLDKFGMATSHICLKVVVFDEEDYEYARSIRQAFPWAPFYLSVGTLMGGLRGTWGDGYGFPSFESGRVPIDTRDSLLTRYKWLVERVARDVDFGSIDGVLPQLHALIWGHERGH